MRLLETCEPLFQYICKLNRKARSAENPPVATVRADLVGLLQEIQQSGRSDAGLAKQLKEIELPLVFFVDSIIADESDLQFKAEWNQHRLAYEMFNELTGDEKFYKLLDQTLQDPGAEASERLLVYYVCLGLGFKGMYFDQPDQLRGYMMRILPRIREWVEIDPTARICKETYGNVDTRDLTEPPSRKMQLIGVLFAFFTLSALATYYWMFKAASEDLSSSLNQINSSDHSAAR